MLPGTPPDEPTALMAPRLPGLLKGRRLEARVGLALLGAQSGAFLYWAAPWRADDVTVGSFLRGLPILGAVISASD